MAILLNEAWHSAEVLFGCVSSKILWIKEKGLSDEEAKERCMEVYRDEKRKVKRFIYQSKKKVNEQFGRKKNEYVNGNRKLFLKEVSNAKGGKVESCMRKNDGNGRLAQEEDDVRKIWKEYFEGLYNIDTQEQVAVPM